MKINTTLKVIQLTGGNSLYKNKLKICGRTQVIEKHCV